MPIIDKKTIVFLSMWFDIYLKFVCTENCNWYGKSPLNLENLFIIVACLIKTILQCNRSNVNSVKFIIILAIPKLLVYLWNLKWPGDDARWEGGGDEKRENRPAGESVAGVSFPISAVRICSHKVPKYCQGTAAPTWNIKILPLIRYFKTLLF